MKTKTSLIISAVVLVLAMLACDTTNLPFGLGSTSTPLPTYTPLPTLTPYPTFTPLPTNTPLPTATPKPTIEDVLLANGFTRDSANDQYCSAPCKAYWNENMTMVARAYNDGGFVIYFMVSSASNNPAIAVVENVVSAIFGPDFATWYETTMRTGFKAGGTYGTVDGRSVSVYANTNNGYTFIFYQIETK